VSFVGIVGQLKKAAACMRCSERNSYSEVNKLFLSRSVTIITFFRPDVNAIHTCEVHKTNMQTVVDVMFSKFMAPKPM
jgi:hypothetical protein